MSASTRRTVLESASKAVLEDRNNTYGAPEDNFAVIADLWSAYLLARCTARIGVVEVTPTDVAALMILFKLGRVCTATAPQIDSWVDIAGYAACGASTEAEARGTWDETSVD